MTNEINRLTKPGKRQGLLSKNIHVWLKPFYALVKPIILYACESSGNDISGSLNNINSIFKDSFEKLHIKICKQILGTDRKTMNALVLAELGRFPMKLSIDIQMVNYFFRLDKLPGGFYTNYMLRTNHNRKTEKTGTII